MGRYLKKTREEIGLSPQALVFRGHKKIDKVLLRIVDFKDDDVEEKTIDSVKELAPYKEKKSITWLNMDGLHDLKLLEEIGAEFELENFILANVLEVNLRPMVHEYNNCIYLSLKMLRIDNDTNVISAENFSMVFNDSILISFQEKKGDVFNPIRERIRNSKKKLRSSGTDYLAYALLDVIIDNYLFVLGLLGDRIESFDDIILENSNKNVISQITHYKKELNFIRKSIKPAREMILSLSKIESDFIHEKNDIHFKELLNNINQASDISDSYRDVLSDQLSTYHTIISSKLNDIMKFLTIFSVIFIPLTFIAGIYGTNFEFLPELHMKYGYYIMLGCMALVTITMLIFFRKKKWL